VNKGAVVRFFSYHTQEDTAAVRAACGEENIKVYDYDFQVHARTDALIGGKFDISLPTSKNTKGYLILSKNGYQKLEPHSTMCGWNIATVAIAENGRIPFTINLNSSGQPIVGDGSNRTLPHALPVSDDLIGVRIVEIIESPLTSIFKDGKLPAGTIVTDKGFKYVEMFTGKGKILSNSMLDGWFIAEVTPKSSSNWKADIINGEVVITFNGDVYDETVTVLLMKLGSSETREVEIMFSGEKKGLDLGGCNAGTAMLALLALAAFFARRKG
jgi:Synergist-CTERM protein sorting domain-containing protein